MATDNPALAAQGSAGLAGLKARFAALEAQADRVDALAAEAHMDSHGLVFTSHLTLK
jgi:hypothetical protein